MEADKLNSKDFELIKLFLTEHIKQVENYLKGALLLNNCDAAAELVDKLQNKLCDLKILVAKLKNLQ